MRTQRKKERRNERRKEKKERKERKMQASSVLHVGGCYIHRHTVCFDDDVNTDLLEGLCLFRSDPEDKLGPKRSLTMP